MSEQGIREQRAGNREQDTRWREAGSREQGTAGSQQPGPRLLPRVVFHELEVVAVRVLERGDDAAPGFASGSAEELHTVAFDLDAKHGLEKSSRIGYSVGLGYPPDWGEHTMSLRPGDTTVLEPGMAFHMILGMWLDDWGYELSETFVVTDDHAECLADVPRGLVVKA